MPEPVLLEFDRALALEHERHPLRDNLSVAVRTGRDLWVASDETAMLERLTEVAPGRFAAHRRFALHDHLDLPGGADEEVDIEGLGFDGRYLWVAGSHGLRRRKPKRRRDMGEQLARLSTVVREASRYVLARIPCVPDGDGHYTLHRRVTPAGLPFVTRSPLVAAQLRAQGAGNDLTRALADDPHLAPFLDIPGKDNGFDVEGLACAHDRLYLGLRGPVLRGFAVVLSMEFEVDPDEERVLRLAKAAVAPEDGSVDDRSDVRRRYAKHFLDLGGLGVRDLVADGDDVLVLAGPTMVLDGTIAVFRWRGGAHAQRDAVVHRRELERLFTIPHGVGTDRAEGMTLWPGAGGGESLLVVYDSPDPARCADEAAVHADLFPLDRRP